MNRLTTALLLLALAATLGAIFSPQLPGQWWQYLLAALALLGAAGVASEEGGRR